MKTLPISVIILTYNEERNIEKCLQSVKGWVQEIIVVDSYSVDATKKMAEEYGARVVSHPFKNQADQFNWALDTIPITTEWILRLDADEEMSKNLWEEIAKKIPHTPPDINGFYMKRRVYFMGRWIKHGGYYPTWILRLWRKGKARIESREMDEHTILLEGRTEKLENDFIDNNQKNLESWTAKHNDFSTREVYARLKTEKEQLLAARAKGEQPQKKRWIKERVYLKLPLFLRVFMYFFYRYIVRVGFLDGKEGLVFHVLQGFWHQFLIDAKYYEIMKNQNYSKEAIRGFWNKKPCGTFGKFPENPDMRYFDRIRARRYEREPIIKEVGGFSEARGKKVLEIGCGVGTDGSEFARHGAQYSAVDLSEESLRLAKANFALHGLQGNFINSDTERLPFPDNSFDHVYSWGVIHHTPNTQKAFTEIYRVLKPGGTCCVMVYGRHSLVGLQLYMLFGLGKLKPFTSFKKLFADHHESPGTQAFTDKEIQAMTAQFKHVDIMTWVTPYDVRITRNRYFPEWIRDKVPSGLGFFKIIRGQK